VFIEFQESNFMHLAALLQVFPKSTARLLGFAIA